jgi:hypothetical protein
METSSAVWRDLSTIFRPYGSLCSRRRRNNCRNASIRLRSRQVGPTTKLFANEARNRTVETYSRHSDLLITCSRHALPDPPSLPLIGSPPSARIKLRSKPDCTTVLFWLTSVQDIYQRSALGRSYDRSIRLITKTTYWARNQRQRAGPNQPLYSLKRSFQ